MYQLYNLSPTFLNMPEVEVVLDVFLLFLRVFSDRCMSISY